MVTTARNRLAVEANHSMGGNKFRMTKGCDVCTDCDRCPFDGGCRASMVGNRMVANRTDRTRSDQK